MVLCYFSHFRLLCLSSRFHSLTTHIIYHIHNCIDTTLLYDTHTPCVHNVCTTQSVYYTCFVPMIHKERERPIYQFNEIQLSAIHKQVTKHFDTHCIEREREWQSELCVYSRDCITVSHELFQQWWSYVCVCVILSSVRFCFVLFLQKTILFFI